MTSLKTVTKWPTYFSPWFSCHLVWQALHSQKLQRSNCQMILQDIFMRLNNLVRNDTTIWWGKSLPAKSPNYTIVNQQPWRMITSHEINNKQWCKPINKWYQPSANRLRAVLRRLKVVKVPAKLSGRGKDERGQDLRPDIAGVWEKPPIWMVCLLADQQSYFT